MRKLTVLLLLISSMIVNAQSAVEYLNEINEQYEEISKDTWKYMKTVAHSKSARKIEKKRKELIETTYSAKSKIRTLRGFEGDKSYRDSVVAFLTISYNVLKNDYDKIMDMEEIAEQSYDAMEAYLLAQKTATQKINEASDRLSAAQKVFCEKNNIELIEDESERSKNIGIASEVFDYYNEFFLIFFKCQVQETKLMLAINAKDINAMEQIKSALLMYADEGLTKLETMEPYKADNSLRLACSQMLKFYKSEAEEKVDEYIEFFMLMEKFEKIKTSLENKKEKERTKEDIDEYNETANAVNKELESFNKMNESLNDKRSKLLEDWNKKVSSFTDKHVPKG